VRSARHVDVAAASTASFTAGRRAVDAAGTSVASVARTPLPSQHRRASRIIRAGHHDFRRGSRRVQRRRDRPSRATRGSDRHAVRRAGNPTSASRNNRIRRSLRTAITSSRDRGIGQFPSPRPTQVPSTKAVRDARSLHRPSVWRSCPRCGGATSCHARCTSAFGHHCVRKIGLAAPSKTVVTRRGPRAVPGRGDGGPALAATSSRAALLVRTTRSRRRDSAIACAVRSAPYIRRGRRHG